MSHSTAAGGRPEPGLQPERTSLAWTRTSFALLANGALLTIKNLDRAHGLPGLIPALLAATAASCTYMIALQRQRTLERRPIPARITPRRQVYIVGIAVLLLITVTAVAQLL
ncbi:DUF202 domain-containing protein [Mycobacterium sp.]|uniref:DUF202 domain-containing protein n=1 Tax=Mycobacterium sp. TaxID=1785 RepID=UPI003F9C9269